MVLESCKGAGTHAHPFGPQAQGYFPLFVSTSQYLPHKKEGSKRGGVPLLEHSPMLCLVVPNPSLSIPRREEGALIPEFHPALTDTCGWSRALDLTAIQSGVEVGEGVCWLRGLKWK